MFGKIIVLGVVAGIAALVGMSLPDIARYLKIRQM